MTTTKNIYQKLQQARIELAEMKLPKTGLNKFAGYKYYELADFLPATQSIFNKVGLCGVVDFNTVQATLTIIDTDAPDSRILFCSPQAGSDLKCSHAIQNAGAVITYQRRYLYMAAMEITEPDSVDSSAPAAPAPAPTAKPAPSKKQPITAAQYQAMTEYIEKNGIGLEAMRVIEAGMNKYSFNADQTNYLNTLLKPAKS